MARAQDIQLMPQNKDFSFQPPPRLQLRRQPGQNETGDPHHRSGSCHDSPKGNDQWLGLGFR